MTNLFKLAYKAAEKSTHSKHHLAAVIVKGGSILSVAHNLQSWNSCAERRAIRKHMDYRGSTILVVRSNKGISKPCAKCRLAIIKAGIKKVIYIDEDGDVVVEKI
jgi:deoxycytidylate deaminase